MSDPSFQCVVSADLFRRTLFAVSTEETRYYLTGVHISPAPEGGAVLVGTNGHFLIAAHDPDAHVSGEGIVVLDKPMKAALKATGVLLEKRLLLVRRTPDKQRAFVADLPMKGADEDYSPYAAAVELFDEPDKRVKAAQFGAATIDGNFPNWRQIIPTSLNPSAPIPPVDQALLSKVAEALSGDTKMRRIRMTCTGDAGSFSPVLVTNDELRAVSAFAIVMPVRGSDAIASVPAWARTALQIAA